MQQIALELFDSYRLDNGKFVILPPNPDITIQDNATTLGNGNKFSFPFSIPIIPNIGIIGTAAEIRGGKIHDVLEGRWARLWLEGAPFFTGKLKLEKNIKINTKGSVAVTLEGGRKTFAERIEGINARQVPLLNDILIGMALWRKRKPLHAIIFDIIATNNYDMPMTASWADKPQHRTAGAVAAITAQDFPKMVMPYGEFYDYRGNGSFLIQKQQTINTDMPYDDNVPAAHPYCNIALCYQKQGFPTDENGNVDYSQEEQALRGYEYSPADRLNSAPCFYVMYFLRCLFNHLDIQIDENQMQGVEDLRRLFFVNTLCDYEVPAFIQQDGTDKYGYYKFGPSDSDRNYIPMDMVEGPIEVNDDKDNTTSAFSVTDYKVLEKTYDGIDIKTIKAKVEGFAKLSGDALQSHKIAYAHKAFATSKCFPDAKITDIIAMLEDAFGVRFIFDDEEHHVRIVLMRNILADKDVQHIELVAPQMQKTDINIKGYKLTYGQEDTSFNYKGLYDLLHNNTSAWPVLDTDNHDYSKFSMAKSYEEIIKSISAFDNTCYITPDTGNAYIIKVDESARKYTELHPSLFPCAEFMDAEDGDCSGEEEELIHTVKMGFTPAIMNDVNYEKERQGETKQQRFALFVDEQMASRRWDFNDLPDGKSYNQPDVIYDISKLYKNQEKKQFKQETGAGQLGRFEITSDAPVAIQNFEIWVQIKDDMKYDHIHTQVPAEGWPWRMKLQVSLDGYINEGYRLFLQDNFTPNDDGISPLETHQWGLTLGIMRGSGSDAQVQYTPDVEEDEGNDTWQLVPGSSDTVHYDVCDAYGVPFAYSGQAYIQTAAQAIQYLQREYPDSNFPFDGHYTAIQEAATFTVTTDTGAVLTGIRVRKIDDTAMRKEEWEQYIEPVKGKTPQEIMDYDASRLRTIITLYGNIGQAGVIPKLHRIAKGSGETVILDNGVATERSRFSLKLRAEKPNPFFDNTKPESPTNKKRIDINLPRLRERGIMDTFHKELSYLMLYGHVATVTGKTTAAYIRNIDKTKKAEILGIIGLIKSITYKPSNDSPLGEATIEMYYL